MKKPCNLKQCFASLILLGVTGTAWLQEIPQDQQDQTISEEALSETAMPRQFHGIQLGMSMDEVKELLLKDAWFDYQGDPEVSLLERPRATIIDAGGSLFIERGLFQFENDSLSGIILELNPKTMDWFTMYTSLETKYGNPGKLNPARVWWNDAQTRLALERPLTVKYLDLGVFELAAEEKASRLAWREKARQEFLYEF